MGPASPAADLDFSSATIMPNASTYRIRYELQIVLHAEKFMHLSPSLSYPSLHIDYDQGNLKKRTRLLAYH